MKFAVGQRVICVRTALGVAHGDTPETWNHIGYYGHVQRIDPVSDVILQPVYWVKLSGRAGCEAAPWMLNEPWFNPFSFWEDQLEAAD